MTTNLQELHITSEDCEGSPLKRVGGSDTQIFNNELIRSALESFWYYENTPPERRQVLRKSLIFALMAFAPTDEIEGMIAAQAVAMHYTVMECSRRAMIRDQPYEIEQGYRKAAANSSRAFTGLLDTLDRKRGKGGQQKVTVEHVHVHAGGQAIVGNVESGTAGGGGGVEGKHRVKPHAPPARLAHDTTPGPILPPLRSENPERQSVPVSGDAERALPDARRKKHRAPNG